MDPKIKADWVAALRSGKYEQGHGALHDSQTNTYCCLGVLCEVVNAPRFVEEGYRDRLVYYGTKEDFSGSCLPKCVREAAGGIDAYGDYGGESLAHLNDTGTSFEAIALIIEQEF